MVARSKACLLPFACWDYGFESRRVHGSLSVVSVVFCQVEVSATSLSVSQRSPTECGVSDYNYESSIMRKAWPTRACCAMVKKNKIKYQYSLYSKQSTNHRPN